MSKAACSSAVPDQIRKSGNRRGPVLASVCFDSLPSLVWPVTADMGDGTINASVGISPRQSSRGLVSKSELDLPQHKQRVAGEKQVNDRFSVRGVVFNARA